LHSLLFKERVPVSPLAYFHIVSIILTVYIFCLLALNIIFIGFIHIVAEVCLLLLLYDLIFYKYTMFIFYFYFLIVLEFELRALCLLGRCAIILVMPHLNPFLLS
jgi:hypothetical protein